MKATLAIFLSLFAVAAFALTGVAPDLAFAADPGALGAATLGGAGLAAGAALATNYVQPGKIITWTNGTGSAVTAGTVVVVGQTLGVALVDIANGATGSVQIDGVFTVPKVSAAVIAQGESLTWDVSAGAFDDNAATPATGDVTGAPAVAAEAAGNGVTTLNVIFTGIPGTVT